MDTSYQKYYLLNDETKKNSEFSDEFLSKGKSLYEVIRVIDGAPIFLEKHLSRLINSANIVKLILPLSIEEIKEKLNKLIVVNAAAIGNIKIVFNFSDKKCDFYAYFLKHSYPSEEDYKNGVDTILYHGERDNPNAKVINLSFREKADEKIREAKAFEAILVDRNGNITEGSRSNIFMIKDNTVLTAPVEDVLPGITRDTIIAAAKKCGYEVKEQRINYNDIKDLDGLFISGTSPKVLPIRRVDNLQFNSASNKVINDILIEYDEVINKYIENYKLMN